MSLLKDELIKSLKQNVSNFLAFDEVKKTIPTDIKLLDAILGGGFVIGGEVMLVGRPASGKSTLAAQASGALLRSNPDAMAIYLDTEQSFNQLRLEQLGVDTDRAMIISQDVTIEKTFQILDQIFQFKEKHDLVDVPFMVIWDSLAATASEKMDEAQSAEKMTGYDARSLSFYIKKYVKELSRYKVSFVVINQLRDKIKMGPYQNAPDLRWLGDKKVYGGNMIQYLSFTLLYMTPTSPDYFSSDTTGQTSGIGAGFEGSTIKVHTVKNKLLRPNVKVELVLDYNHGFSDPWTNLQFLVSRKKAKSGAWWSIDGIDKKFRSKEFITLYNSDAGFREQFESIVLDELTEFKDSIADTLRPDLLISSDGTTEKIENTEE